MPLTWRFKFTRRRVVLLLLVATFYTALWWLTAAFGVPASRAVALNAMGLLPASAVDISSPNSEHLYSMQRKGQKSNSSQTFGDAPPWYYCRASPYAPFLIRIDYGWATGPLRGDGGGVWYLWAFGAVFRAYEFAHWAM